MKDDVVIYILWGHYPNITGAKGIVDKPLGYYLSKQRAEKLCKTLNDQPKTDVCDNPFYTVEFVEVEQ